MYRIFCESYYNYVKDFKEKSIDEFRYKVIEPFELIVDLEKYNIEKKEETLRYKKLEDFIWLIKKSIDKYPNFKAFLWTLESRGINGKCYEVLKEEELKEQIKIINMFLRLAYWN